MEGIPIKKSINEIKRNKERETSKKERIDNLERRS